MDTIYSIASILITNILFTIVLKLLDAKSFYLFSSIIEFTSKLKQNKTYYFITIFFVAFLNALIVGQYQMNYIRSGIILGIAFSIIDMIFDKNGSISSFNKR